MYCDFYQLTERPFNVTPDPKFLYLNARYREALASLNYGISQRKGFITLIGEAGTGKTTLLKRLLEDLDPKTKTVFIFNTNVTFEEILEYILAEFDLPVHNGKKLYMLQRLNTFLLEELRGAGNVALLIDEAQDLEFSVLEDLRLLSNLETAKEKILQIVLSGQPELGQKLSNPVLRQLRQRIGINCRLLPLSRDEITEYIEYRLQAAQCPDLKLFTREAEDQIFHFSRGIPRLVNVVCDNALVIGYALGKKRISDDIIREAAADLLSLEAKSEDPKEAPVAPVAPAVWSAPSVARRNTRLGVIGLFVLALIVGLLSIGRTMLTRPSLPLPYASMPRSFEVIRPGSGPRGAGVDVPTDGGGAQGDVAAVVEAGDPSQLAAPPAPPARLAALAEPPDPRVTGGSDLEPKAAVPDPTPSPVTLRRSEDLRPPVAAGAEVAPAIPTVGAAESERRNEAQPAVQDMRTARNGTLGAPESGRTTALRVVEAPPPRVTPTPVHKVIEPAIRTGSLAAAKPEAKPTAPLRPAPTQESELDRPAQEEAPLAVAGKRSDAATPGGRSSKTGPGEAREEEPVESPVSESAPRDADSGLAGVEFANQTVRVGDSVSGIAMRKYGQASYTVLDLLKIANPEVSDIDAISVGQTIRLPELGEGYPILKEGGGKYSLLVVSSPHVQKAKELQAALRARGLDARVSNTSVGSGKPLYRVVVGGYASREKVVAAGKQVQKAFRENPSLAELAE